MSGISYYINPFYLWRVRWIFHWLANFHQESRFHWYFSSILCYFTSENIDSEQSPIPVALHSLSYCTYLSPELFTPCIICRLARNFPPSMCGEVSHLKVCPFEQVKISFPTCPNVIISDTSNKLWHVCACSWTLQTRFFRAVCDAKTMSSLVSSLSLYRYGLYCSLVHVSDADCSAFAVVLLSKKKSSTLVNTE